MVSFLLALTFKKTYKIYEAIKFKLTLYEDEPIEYSFVHVQMLAKNSLKRIKIKFKIILLSESFRCSTTDLALCQLNYLININLEYST